MEGEKIHWWSNYTHEGVLMALDHHQHGMEYESCRVVIRSDLIVSSKLKPKGWPIN